MRWTLVTPESQPVNPAAAGRQCPIRHVEPLVSSMVDRSHDADKARIAAARVPPPLLFADGLNVVLQKTGPSVDQEPNATMAPAPLRDAQHVALRD
jgi:hypothetical protein